jgi:hypothetical protein
MREQKLPCKLWLQDDRQPLEHRTEQWEATLHLFEHEYDAMTTFWHAMAEITCQPNDFWGFVTSVRPNDLRVIICLPDGRCGAACYYGGGKLSEDQESQYVSGAVVGVTSLSCP